MKKLAERLAELEEVEKTFYDNLTDADTKQERFKMGSFSGKIALLKILIAEGRE